MADFPPFFEEKNASEVDFQIFHKNISQNFTKENGRSYPPQSLYNSGIAHPPNKRVFVCGNFPKFRP